jgi:hypothetical protein
VVRALAEPVAARRPARNPKPPGWPLVVLPELDLAVGHRRAVQCRVATSPLSASGKRRIVASRPPAQTDVNPNRRSIQADERVGVITFRWAEEPPVRSPRALIDASKMPPAIIMIPTR